MPERRTFGHFPTSSEDKLFFVKKEDMSSKKRTYGKPKLNTKTIHSLYNSQNLFILLNAQLKNNNPGIYNRI